MSNVQTLPYSCASPLAAHPFGIPHAPAKIPTSNRNLHPLIVRTPCLNLRLCSPVLVFSYLSPKFCYTSTPHFTLRASSSQKYVYPVPNPQFAQVETNKFEVELFKKLSEDKDLFGDELHAVIEVCANVFNEFLHREYGGPGTLLVEPFTDMLVALKERKLPGAPLAARASLLWAQNNVDQDWETWNSNCKKI